MCALRAADHSDLVARLQASGVAVYLISGGFRQLIAPIQQQLDIPAGHVFANTILYDDGTAASLLHLRSATCTTAIALEGSSRP
jgi:phosphoserine phosphatase